MFISREDWDAWDPTLISEVICFMILIDRKTSLKLFDSTPHNFCPIVNFKATLQLPSSVHCALVQGLFAAANIFSSLKLVYIFSVNPYLGPLQVLKLSSIIILAINHHSIKAINLSYLSINKLIDDPKINS